MDILSTNLGELAMSIQSLVQDQCSCSDPAVAQHRSAIQVCCMHAHTAGAGRCPLGAKGPLALGGWGVHHTQAQVCVVCLCVCARISIAYLLWCSDGPIVGALRRLARHVPLSTCEARAVRMGARLRCMPCSCCQGPLAAYVQQAPLSARVQLCCLGTPAA